MILVIGLGNPGEKYEKTRHNIGWEVLDKFKNKNDFQSWEEDKKTKAMISKGMFDKKEVQLIKPLTFMNLSGEAIKNLINYYKIKPEEMIVVHDDMDIEFGKIKVSKKRGTAGHKGVLSIINMLKTKNFTRVRIGINPKNKKLISTEKFVLSSFNKKEEEKLEEITNKSIEAVETVIKEGPQKAMNIFNKKLE